MIGLTIIMIAVMNNTIDISNNTQKLKEETYDIKMSNCRTYKIFDEYIDRWNSTEPHGINGFDAYPNFYCVYTKDRTLEEINRTDCHEYCHHITFNDPEHFCSYYKERAQQKNGSESFCHNQKNQWSIYSLLNLDID